MHREIFDEFLEDPGVKMLKNATKRAIMKQVREEDTSDNASQMSDLDEEEMKIENIESI